jgi:hypothetical protein
MIKYLSFIVLSVSLYCSTAQTVNYWKIDNLNSIGGNAVEVSGNPTVVVFDAVDGDGFSAVHFDGVDDGIIINGNPLVGATEFTAEVVFWMEDKVPQEPRFVHFQQDDNNRVLIELRNLKTGEWYIDTFIKSAGVSSTPLIDANNTHLLGDWNHAALIFSNNTMAHYVNGVKELEGPATYSAMTSGKLSLGMRMNKVNFYKGYIKEVRVTYIALDPSHFLINQEKPILKKAFDDLSVKSNFGQKVINLEEAFEGKGIVFAAESTNESVATVSVNLEEGFLFISEVGAGTTTIKITASGASGVITDEFEFTISGSPLAANEHISKVASIYPNPSTGKFKLDFFLSNPSDVLLVVNDLSGKEVVRQNYRDWDAGSKGLDLDFGQLEKGIYIITIQTKSDKNLLKFVLE